MPSQPSAVLSAGKPLRNSELFYGLDLLLELYALELTELLTRAFEALEFEFDAEEYAALLDTLKPELHDLMLDSCNATNYVDEDTANPLLQRVVGVIDDDTSAVVIARTHDAATSLVRYVIHRLSGRGTQEKSLQQQLGVIWHEAHKRDVFPSELLDAGTREWHAFSYWTFFPSVQNGLADVLAGILKSMSNLLTWYMEPDAPEDFTDVAFQTGGIYIGSLQR
jgi:hypothetical protein